MSGWEGMDWSKAPSPAYVVDEAALERNLALLDDVQRGAGCKIIMALKGFSMFSVFPLVRRTLCGAAASSLNEARLAREEFKGEVHVYAPAYRDDEFEQYLELADHIVFNSFSQWRRFRPAVRRARRRIRCGLRVNPEHSEVKVPLYDPCAKGSRLGITLDAFEPGELDGISGLHFHTLCELNADSLERTLPAVEARFGSWFDRLEWINFGGGHHVTRDDYDRPRLVDLVRDFRKRRQLEVYLEPGEAIALNTGVLVASVLDIVRNDLNTAILDTSAAAHMPDVLEMPYRPRVLGAGAPGEREFTFRLAGLTCLAGDVIGDYSFDRPLAVGDRLVFLDMAHYTMVKNNTFNGVNLPAIALCDTRTGGLRVVRSFGYEDFRNRLS